MRLFLHSPCLKSFLSAVSGVLLSAAALGQGVGINASGNPADTSALLDVSSTTKGVLIPRMTTIQRNAIVNPAVGLQIYNTNTDCINIYTSI